MSEIAKLTKEKVMRPSLIGSVDKINEVIDVVNLLYPTEIDSIETRVSTLELKIPNIQRDVNNIKDTLETIENSAISTHTTTGEAYGAIISVTANGHAEQDGTPTPSDPKEIVVVRGHEVTGKTGRYVDLVVTADGTTTTTPIPLPSRGWVGSLPDGTHDALAIDGAGKVTWVLADNMVTLRSDMVYVLNSGNGPLINVDKSGISDVRMADSSGTPALCNVYPNSGTTWTNNAFGIARGTIWFGDTGNVRWPTLEAWTSFVAANPIDVLYPLATAVTEPMGYVDLPDIPNGAVVSIPELEGLNVESWNNDVIYRYVNAIVERAVQ
jgi:hypothetical protein